MPKAAKKIAILAILSAIGFFVFNKTNGNNYLNLSSIVDTKVSVNSGSLVDGSQNYYRALINSEIPVKRADYALYFKDAQNSKPIFTLTSSNSPIIRWHDWLIYGDVEGKDPVNLLIRGYNLVTQEKRVVYNMLESKDFVLSPDAWRLPDGFGTFKIINDKFIFSVGGYITQGTTYWVSYPPSVENIKLIEKENNWILFEQGNYFLVNGFADGGYAKSTYKLFDVKTMKYKPIATIEIGGGEGEELISFDKDRLIIGAVFPDKNMPMAYLMNKIYSLQFNTGTKKVLISEEIMPPEINDAFYSTSTNQLLLSGKEYLYTYDVSSKKIEKIFDVPAEVDDSSDGVYIDSWKDNEVCLNGRYSFDLKEKKYLDSNRNCNSYEYPTQKRPELNLPDNYEFTWPR